MNHMNKKNLILGGFLVVLIALAYVYQGPFKDWRANLSKPENFLADISVDQINRIEIVKNREATILEQAGEKWRIGGTKDFYVKDNIIGGMFDNLKQAVKADLELVSANKDKKSEFQTNEESGVHVKLMQGEKVLMDFVIGKLASDFVSSYISQSEAEKTYLVKINLNSSFDHDDWYDKTIFSTDKEKITKVRFQYPTREFTIEKQDDIWTGTLPYAFDVDEDEVDEALDIMSNLTAAKIPEQTFKGTGLEEHAIIIQATGENIENTLMVGDPSTGSTSSQQASSLQSGGQAGQGNGGELYYAKKADSDNIYLITKEQRDELDKRISDLK